MSGSITHRSENIPLPLQGFLDGEGAPPPRPSPLQGEREGAVPALKSAPSAFRGEGWGGGRRLGRARNTFLALLLILLAPVARAETPIDPALLAEARAVVAASSAPGQNEQMIAAISGSVAQAVAAANPGREQDAGQVVQEYFVPLLREHFSELSDVPAQEFARSFTKSELDQLLAFYTSALGKKLIATQAKVDVDMNTQGPQITNRILQQAMKKMGPELGRLGMHVPSFQ